MVTNRLYVADVRSVWSVRSDRAWSRRHVHSIYPMSLSVTDARLLVTCRSGQCLAVFGVDGKLLRRVCTVADPEILKTGEGEKDCISTVCHLSQMHAMN